MTDDPNEHVAQMFHGLVADLQRGDIEQFDASHKKEREARAALRKETPNQGLSAGELLKKMDGDPAEAEKRMLEELARISKEAQAAAAAHKEKKDAPLPDGHFPPPPTSE